MTEEWLDDMVSFVVAKDKESFDSYIQTKKCLAIKSGLHVTVTKSPGMFGGKCEFAFRGYKFWTVREAIDYGN